MQSPLLNQDDQRECEFSIRDRKRTKNFERQDVKVIPEVAFFQVMDLSLDFEPLITQQVPTAFLPKLLNYFKAPPRNKTLYDKLDNVPVFRPDSEIVLMWQGLIVIIIFAYLFYIPYKIAFTDPYDNYNDVIISNTKAVIALLVLTLILLTVDLAVSFNIAVYRHGQLIFDRRVIAQTYLRWAFQLDLLGVLSLLAALISKVDWIRLLFFFRGYYVIRYFDKLQHLLQLHPVMKALFTIFELIMVILLATHYMACIFYGAAIDGAYNGQLNNWIVDNDYAEYGTLLDGNYDTWQRYSASYYWSLTTISTVGYGDITPKNDGEIAIALITMVVAGVVFAFNISSIREVIIDLNYKKERYKQYEIVLNRYMALKRISQKTQVRVREYFDYLWEEEKNRNHEVENILIGRLAPDLKEQLFFETYRDFLNAAVFAKSGCDDKEMREDHFGPGDLVQCQNVEAGESFLFYLINGAALTYSDRKTTLDLEVKIDLVTQGRCFGQIPFFTGEIFQHQIRSIGCSSVYKLGRSKFLSLIRLNQRDFEAYHLLLSQRNNEEFYEKIDLACMTCGHHGHSPTECPLTHLVVDRENLLKSYKFKVKINGRQKFLRRLSHKVSARKDQSKMKSIAHSLQHTQKAQQKKMTITTRSFAVQLDHSGLQQDYVEEDGILEGDDADLGGELGEIKQMLHLIMQKMGIESQENSEDMGAQIVKPFIPAKPSFEPQEQTIDIDKLQNYEIYYPKYNFARVIRRIAY